MQKEFQQIGDKIGADVKFDEWTKHLSENEDGKMAVKTAERNLNKISKYLPDGFEIPNILIIDFSKYWLDSGAIGGHDPKTGAIFINSKYKTDKSIVRFPAQKHGEFANKTSLSPYLHEIGHKYNKDCIKAIAKTKKMCYTDAKRMINMRIDNYIISKYDFDLQHEISSYAK